MQKITGGFIIILSMFFLTHSQVLSQTRDRSQAPEKYKWDLTHLFISDDAWHEAKNKASERIEDLARFKGRLAESPASLLACLQFSAEILKELRRLSSYSWNKTRQDLRDSKYRAMDQESNQLNTKYNTHADIAMWPR